MRFVRQTTNAATRSPSELKPAQEARQPSARRTTDHGTRCRSAASTIKAGDPSLGLKCHPLLDIELFPLDPLAERVWALRHKPDSQRRVVCGACRGPRSAPRHARFAACSRYRLAVDLCHPVRGRPSTATWTAASSRAAPSGCDVGSAGTTTHIRRRLLVLLAGTWMQFLGYGPNMINTV